MFIFLYIQSKMNERNFDYERKKSVNNRDIAQNIEFNIILGESNLISRRILIRDGMQFRYKYIIYLVRNYQGDVQVRNKFQIYTDFDFHCEIKNIYIYVLNIDVSIQQIVDKIMIVF